MILSDILLTDTGDIYYGTDIAIAEGDILVKQNMFTFLRSEPEDMPLNPAMAFGMLDYANMPNTKESADLVKRDFMEKVSLLEPFAGYAINADIFPTDIKEMKMEVTVAGPAGTMSTLSAPIIYENGFVSNIPSKFSVNIYNNSTSRNIIERVTLLQESNKVPVKYVPEIEEFIIFSPDSAPELDSENNLSDIQIISGTLSLTSVSISMDEELPILSGKRIESYLFEVSGVTLERVDSIIDDVYQYTTTSADQYDIEFDQAYSTLDYVIEYQDSVAIASDIEETEIELPKPENLIFPFATEDRLYKVVLDRYLDVGTYIIQYRSATVE